MKHFITVLTLIIAGITTMANAETFKNDVQANGHKIEITYKKHDSSAGDYWIVWNIEADGEQVHIPKSSTGRARLSDAQFDVIQFNYITLVEKIVEKALDKNVSDVEDIKAHVKRNRDLRGSVEGSRVDEVSPAHKNAIWNTLPSYGAGDDKSHRILIEDIARGVYELIK